jgi:cobalt/nickel transport system permease protein
MHPSFVDRYSRLQSPVHRLSAPLKLVATIMLVTASLAAWPWPAFVWGGVAVILLACAIASTIPPSFLVRRVLLLEIFVLGMAGLSLLRPNGREVFLAITIKSTLCLLTLILFTNTTPFTELLLMLRRVKTPALIVTLLALMYRYLFLFVDELERMRRARTSRTFAVRRAQVWKSYASIIAQLFIRSVERGERVFAAMCARGWQ